MTEYDAKAVAVDVIVLLRSHWRSMLNDRTDSILTSHRRNECGPGISEAIKVIAETYGIDVGRDGDIPQIRPDEN